MFHFLFLKIPSRHSSAGSGGIEGEDFQSVTLLSGGNGLSSGRGNGGDNTLRIGSTRKRPSISLRDLQQGEKINKK